MNYLFEEKYQKNKELFLKNLVNDLISKNKLSFQENEEEENKLIAKLIQDYSAKSKKIIERIKKEKKKILSYKKLKKYLKEEKLYLKNNREKTELFKLFLYILKKNSTCKNENISLYDFIAEDIINFLNGIVGIANEKMNTNDTMNDGITVGDEDFKNIINTFLKDLKNLLDKSNLKLDELLGDDNINIMMKEGKEIQVMNIYTFIHILREKGLQLNDNFIISCVFAKYQIEENLEEINLNLLENDLKIDSS